MASIRDCKQIQPLLSEYVDGALSTDSAWNVQMHLSSCAVCARIAVNLESTVALLKALPRPETSATFEEKLAVRLADQAMRPHRTSLGDRLRVWWATPRVPPTVATVGALAAMVPIVVVAAMYVSPLGWVPTSRAAATRQQFVEKCVQEHASFASSDPLGDPSAMLLSASPRSAIASDGSQEERL